MASSKEKNGVDWECFMDHSFHDMWAVRPLGDKDYYSPRLFHFVSMKDALMFKGLIERSYHAIPA